MLIPDFFQMQKCIYLSTKHTGQQIHSLLTLANVLMANFVEKKLIKKILKIEKLDFCQFWCQFWCLFSLKKTEIISSLKITGQRVANLGNVLNIPIHGVCRNCDKNCIKILKLENFGFLTFSKPI